MVTRRVANSLIAAAFVVSPGLSRSAGAQLVGVASRAADFAPVDASALGVSRQSSVGLSTGNSGLALGGGMGLWSGALHAYFGAGSYDWSAGLAYSQTSIARRVMPGIHATLGEQLSSGYRHFDRYGYEGALNLRVPVGLTLGNPDGASIAVYAAPYGEVGLEHYFGVTECPSFGNCTPHMVNRPLNAAGVGIGLRASAGRVSIAALFGDIAYRNRFHLPNPASLETLGLSVQLGK